MNLHPTLRLLLLVVPVVSQSPFDDLMKCAQAGASPDQCTSTSMADGESCVFCTSPSLGQSVCTTPQISDAAKQFLPDLDCGDSMNEQEENEEGGTTGGLDDPFSDILLCAQQSGDEDQCTSTETSDGGDCVYCTSASVQQPVCTTESASQMMKQLLPDLDCGGDVATNTAAEVEEEREEEKEQPSLRDNIQDLLLCVQSGASPQQCTSTEMSDGEHCVFCKSSSVKQDVCTTPSASSIMKQVIPNLDCGGDDASSAAADAETVDESIQDTFQDIVTCAQASTSADACGSTTMSDGEGCLFCTSDSIRQSICTTPTASEAIKQLVQDFKCGDSRLRGKTQTHAAEEMLDLIPSSCIPSSGLDDEACSEAKDAATGEDCIWCPSLAGNYGICLSHDEAEIVSKKGWFKCPEEADVLSVAIE
mmetsp:Transcript_12097/g.26175  ORF Transcript_12097/g.26175 Transcript_12097/m.26175 type:complete len:420 (+) Transcript_12097:188-1447(+)|eukprot:CAMPEP_0178518540 /NCGR_PEP_ID=MMETSP0696-20121128/26322_1 /TAXON_ID=265572 /ORGANISM="Extubocellulus spinifer, Strain CCMP396" /LENGTH=419 /DNA_ID=CAMNT_0020149131 /DNA_START=129 /DNA_END=1388 /DNA_ORIENTATION=-